MEPAVEKLPPGQIVHPDALSVPAFVTSPAKPGAHIEQAEMDELPVEEFVVKIPEGHIEQNDAPANE